MIDLEQRPEYWQRLGALPEAIHVFVERDDDTLYRKWLYSRNSDLTVSQVSAQAKKVRTMIHDIKSNGYDPERWRSDPRRFAGLGVDDFGPIVVSMKATEVWPWDGAHRSCILRSLGLPVRAEVRQS